MSQNFDPNQNYYSFNKKNSIHIVFIHGVGLDHQMCDYQINYSTNGPCPTSTTETVTVNTPPEIVNPTPLEVCDDNITQCIHKISPLYNRAIIFLNSDTSYHGVPEVNFERRAFTFSILKNAIATKRIKALFVARPTDSEEVREEGFKRSIIKDVTI